MESEDLVSTITNVIDTGSRMESDDLFSTIRNVIDTETRLVLVGRTGEGKTSTANSIIGSKRFTVKSSAKSVTKRCSYVKMEVLGKSLGLVDTPGLFDTADDNENTLLEISKCLIVSAPGPHAFLMVLTTLRFTKEIKESVERLRNAFGEHVLMYTIIIFTRKDDLDQNETTIEEFLNTLPDYMTNLLEACRRRYVFFNNRLSGEGNELQIQTLLCMVDSLIAANEGECYSSQQYKEVEAKIQEEDERRKQEIELEKQNMIAPYIENQKRSEEKQAKLEKEKSEIEDRKKQAEDELEALQQETMKKERKETERRRQDELRLNEVKLQREEAERGRKIEKEQYMETAVAMKQEQTTREVTEKKHSEDERARIEAEDQRQKTQKQLQKQSTEMLLEKEKREDAEKGRKEEQTRSKELEKKKQEAEEKLEKVKEEKRKNEKNQEDEKKKEISAKRMIDKENKRAARNKSKVRDDIRYDAMSAADVVVPLAGVAAGAGSGAVIGSVVPVVGTAIGGAVGGIAGGIIGFIGRKLSK